MIVFGLVSNLVSQTENVGIGIATPNFPLHIHKHNSDHVYLNFTNNTTGSTLSDGAIIGLDQNENFLISLFENTNVEFWTNSSRRMKINWFGNVGINTTNPLTRLHVHGGSIVTGDLTVGGTDQMANGYLTFYNKSKGAFRAGRILNDNWQPDSLGNYSFAAGWSPKASGSTAVALGYLTEATGSYATALGYFSKAEGSFATAFGYYANARANGSVAGGYETTASGTSSISLGSGTVASGLASVSLGLETVASGRAAIALGRDVVAPSAYEIVVGSKNEPYSPVSTTEWELEDRLFSIGNGNVVDHNALTVLKNGNVGINTTEPDERLHVNNPASDVGMKLSSGDGSLTTLQLFESNDYGFQFQYDGTDDKLHLASKKFAYNDAIRMTWLKSGRVGINTTEPVEGLHLHDRSFRITDAGPENSIHMYSNGSSGYGGEIRIYDADGTSTIRMKGAETGTTGADVALRTSGGITTISLDAEYGTAGVGHITTDEIEITGGSDLSENFGVIHEFVESGLKPGMVVSIDPAGSGKLVLTQSAYDRCVVGVISGANGLRPGMIMAAQGTIADGNYPIALVGRVYVLADATHGTIEPGDLLTSSDLAGHVMGAKKSRKAKDAIVGKAMTGLEQGKGLILMLISLQ